eukprot:gnl/Spiro4/4667_TR2325_c0_g1_i1.p1 gnl/Spiro4/4667_TR2325_c0_g1~~gnl/Spiro4/4667_TR2325_c0_g1_i1.p1  ORF type:complete len:605 (-),score=104.94 gnl/Spiro4/4667_TR2325_c0_g1_i1:19-1833(-)
MLAAGPRLWPRCSPTLRSCSSTFSRAFSGDPDYIVVGAGSAGCVLANRLSEDRATRVTVIEAGPSDRGSWDQWKISMPAALTFNLAGTKYNWDYYTTPQSNLDGRRLHQPRGKVLGGSSSLNAMVYIRGHALDYDDWSIQAPGWSYSDVLPYFRKAQTHELGANQYRGSVGPLHVRRGCHDNVLNHVFIRGGIESGYPYTEDMNGFQQEGFGFMDMTIGADGKRCSAAAAYLHPALSRSLDWDNLQVNTNCLVRQILFERSASGHARAVGVEYEEVFQSSSVHRVFAQKEVIVSLGAIGSPQLLMLSGIGDADHLRSLDIPVLVHSPEVGRNFQDHIEVYIQYLCKEPVTLYPIGGWRYPHKKIAAGLQWFARGTGACASNHFEVGGFIRSRPGLSQPNLQYHFIPACVVGQLDFLPQHGFQAHVGTMRPESRGSVRLASRNPRTAPLIDPNYLATPQDVTDMRTAVRLTAEMFEQSACWDRYRQRRYDPLPEDDLSTDAAVDAWVRRKAQSAYHPSCSVAMGHAVDNEGRVFGVDGLRVVDASIMPFVVSGNLNAPTIMVAEKMADHIRGLTPLQPTPAPVFRGPPDMPRHYAVNGCALSQPT